MHRAEFRPEQRWAIYARFSSDRQREASIGDQVRLCREFLERNGGRFRPDLVFEDRAQSGAGTDRDGFTAMMRALTARPTQIDGILAEDVSRISRDIADSAAFFKELKHHGVQLVGVSDGINSAQPSAK
ncbi:MAG TPA: recombinase family protein, partial [Polyangiales bacterium]|nr:recombinase family protein [Polyangiales bacterium]